MAGNTGKLLLKPGMRVGFVNPPAGHLDLLGPLPEGARVAAAGEVDLLLVFARNRADVAAAAPEFKRVSAGKLLWIAYPKGGAKKGTDLNRDILWEQVQPSGLVGVTLVALDDTWSAMRFKRA
jgi:hypothetical protein